MVEIHKALRADIESNINSGFFHTTSAQMLAHYIYTELYPDATTRHSTNPFQEQPIDYRTVLGVFHWTLQSTTLLLYSTLYLAHQFLD
jgi:hypothetical protein